MKKIAFLFSLIFLSLLLWRIGFSDYFKTTQAPDGKWKVYEKQADQLSARAPTAEEEVFLGSKAVEKKATPTREPANISPQNETPLFENRRIVGNLNQKSLDLRPLNEPSIDWEQSLAEEMMRFQNLETKLFIKHDEQVILASEKLYRYVEEVTVTYQKEDGELTSFKAWIDSENGQLLNTWSRTIVHNFRKPAQKYRPSNL